ncbi:MAG: tape measure protein [Bacteroidales bacterium]|nr:tape measure protein [Bacteroidales bacterium]
MDSNVKFTIDLEVLGLKDTDRAPQSIKAVANAVADLTDLINPLKGIQEQLSGISLKLGDIGKAGQKAGADVKKSLFDGLGESAFSFNNILSSAQTVAGAIAPIFEEGMARQNAEVQFSTLLGSKEEGIAYAKELRDSTMATLYGNSTVNDAAKNMLAFGLDTQTISPILESIGDIAAGDAQKFGSLSLAFAQISSAGKLGGQDLMQLINAGFNPLQEISKKTGKSIGELKDEMAKGAISAKDVEEAFRSATAEGGQFYNMSEDIKNNTLGGKLAVLSASFDDLKAKIFEAVLPLAEKLLPVISDMLIPAIDSVVSVVAPLFTFIAENIDTIGVFAGVILSVVGAMKAWSVIQGIINALMAANPVGLVVVAIAALVAFVYKLIKAWDSWGAAITLILGPFGLVISAVKTFWDYWDSIVEAFKSDGIIAGLKRIGTAILDIILYPVQQLLGWIAELTGWEWAQNATDTVEGYRKSLDAIDHKKSEEETEEVSGKSDIMASLSAAVNGDGSGATLQEVAQQGTNAVSTGGQRNTTINITLDSMVDTINFTGSIDENSEDLTSKVQNALLRVLYSAQTAI